MSTVLTWRGQLAFAAASVLAAQAGAANAEAPAARLWIDRGEPAAVRESTASDMTFAAQFAGWSAPAVPPDVAPAAITVSKAGDGLGAPVDLRAYALAAALAARRARSLPGGLAQFAASLPVAARRITGSYGVRQNPLLGGWRMHSGLDLAAPAGSPIFSPSDGVVTFANWRGGYGLLVEVAHGGGMATRFGHLSRIAVLPGQSVRRGDVLGLVGSTGRSTGPHLHYETRVNGIAVNPLGVHGR